jgi:UDP-N-acetylmuramyl tripeptide synthase
VGSLSVDFENVRKAVDEASRRASPAPQHGAPLLGTAISGRFNAPSALAAQAAALEAIQRMLEELKKAVETLQAKEDERR